MKTEGSINDINVIKALDLILVTRADEDTRMTSTTSKAPVLEELISELSTLGYNMKNINREANENPNVIHVF